MTRRFTRLSSLPPAPSARAYLDQLIAKLETESDLGIRITLREAFDRMVELARAGKALPRALPPPLKPPPAAQ